MPRFWIFVLLVLTWGCGESGSTTSSNDGDVSHSGDASASETLSSSPPAGPAAVPSEGLSAAVATIVSPLTVEQVREGWIHLFDGLSLFGWEPNNPDVNWSVVDGTITADSGPQGLLLTRVPFADFEFHCEFQMDTGGNSGVFLRTTAQPQDVAKDCYELNIADEHPAGFLTGSFVGRQQATQQIRGSGAWMTLDVRAVGDTFSVDLDGKRVLDHTDTTPGARAAGLIGLQKNAGKIQFREIRLRPLLSQTLFDGLSLTGWNEVPGSKAKFAVRDGVIECRGGEGFLQTDQDFGDFILQLDAATLAPAVNSGFFFRTEPGTEKAPSNGYEVQVDNTTDDDERTKPGNAGTGAIFRRAEARVVVSDDNQWATITLAAAGPRFMTWVNGYPVVDWEDNREANPNPRKGLRLEPGRISLQGHDPTTAVMFRNFRIEPLPAR